MMVAVAAMFAFASCDKEPAPAPTPEGGKLATPVLSVVDVTETGFTVVWDAIENAAAYSVVFNRDIQTVTENRIVFTNLNKGSYIVRVKAVGADGSNWEDSGYGEVTGEVTGLTSVDWFTQELFLGVDEEAGAYEYNSVFFTWKGNGVKAISYGFFETAQVEGVDEATIKANMELFDDAEVIAEINSEEGATYFFGGEGKNSLNGDTSYTLFALVTNNDGLEFFTSTECTTDAAETSEAAAKWLGTWNMTSFEKVTFGEDGSITVSEAEEDFVMTIYGDSSNPNGVIIDGYSVLGEGWPAVGIVDEEGQLNITSGTTIGYDDYGYYIWLAYCVFGETGQGQFIGEQIPVLVFAMDENGEVTSGVPVLEGQDGNGNPIDVTPLCTEIFLLDGNSGDLYFLIEAFPVSYRCGAMAMEKAEATASKKFVKGPSQRKAAPAGISNGMSVVF